MSEGIPEGWKLSTISDFAHVKGGKRLPKGRPFAPTRTAFPYLRVSDFKNGTVSFDNIKYVHEEDRNHIKRYTISKNDLYISIAGSLGIVGEVPARLDGTLLTENAAKLVLKDRGSVSKTFLKYYLLSEDAQKHFLQSKGTGGGVPKLALFRIEETPILLPTSPEQQKIASILTSVDEVIETTEAQIGKLQDLKKGMMQELLTKGIGHTEFMDSPVGRIPKGWEITSLIELSKNGISNGVFRDPKMVGSGYRLINVYDMYQGFGVDIDSVELLRLEEKVFQRNKVEYGDIFFTRSSLKLEGIAYCNINLSNEDDITYDGHLMRVQPNLDFVLPKYITYYCLSDYARKYLMSVAKHSTMTTISQQDIAPLYVALPSLSEQQKIVNALDSIESCILAKRDRLSAFNNTKKALMQDLLTGNVRVNLS